VFEAAMWVKSVYISNQINHLFRATWPIERQNTETHS